MAGPDIQINFGNPRPRRRRRRAVGGIAGLLAVALAAWIGSSKLKSPPAQVPVRLLAAAAARERVSAHELGRGLEQVAATVIDQGVMRQVPYLSWRAGGLELNVYGDPDAPSGAELGWFGDASKRGAVREMLAGLLREVADRDALKALDLAKGRSVRGGLTFEVTPETAPDAYGGWWVSVYDASALDGIRAGAGELDGLAAPRPPAEAQRSRRPGTRSYPRGYTRRSGAWVKDLERLLK